MVEGPGCKVKGEKLHPRAKGQVVKGVLGNAVDRHTKKKRKSPGEDSPAVPAALLSPYHVLLGHACSEVLTLGKELFMFFDGLQVCLRVHFLMAGGYRVNGEKLDGEGGGEANTASLVLRMSKDVIKFNKSSVEMRPAEESRSRILNFRHLDICSSHFSHQRAVETLMVQDESRLVCDLLLDQTLLPGVGNIIKNEALFDSGIKPDTTLSALTEIHVSFMVKMTRDFSMIFYKCRRDNKNLQPYLKIYRKGKCGQCGGKAVTTRMGVDNGRLTSYCPHCQDNDISKIKLGKLPSKNSLLGWVTTGTVTPSPEWACALCTFLNKSSSVSCAMCLTARPVSSSARETDPAKPTVTHGYNAPPSKSTVTHGLNAPTSKPTVTLGHNAPTSKHTVTRSLNTPTSKPTVTYGHNAPMSKPTVTHGYNVPTSKFTVTRNHNAPSSELASPCYTSNIPAYPTLSPIQPSVEIRKTRGSDNRGNNPAQPLGSSRVQDKVQTRGAPGGKGPTHPGEQPSKRMCLREVSSSTQSSPQGGAVMQNGGKTSAAPPGGNSLTLPVCPTHKAPCLIREVRKENQNKHRMFFSCPARQCNFFKWADEGFPHCEAHGKRCVLRTVLKEGANNGRKFFACPQPKKKQCTTFQWADQYNNVTVR